MRYCTYMFSCDSFTCFAVLHCRIKVCIVTLLSAASFIIVSSGGSLVVWLSIFGQLTIFLLSYDFMFVCLFAWGLMALSAQIGYIVP